MWKSLVVVVMVMQITTTTTTATHTTEAQTHKLTAHTPRNTDTQTYMNAHTYREIDKGKDGKTRPWNSLSTSKKIKKKKKKEEGLGKECVSSRECEGISNVVCVKGRCLCKPHYLALNSTHCLPGVLLGFECEYDAQCSIRVPHSSCVQGYCRCGRGYVSYWRNNCLKVAKVGGTCRNHEQCYQGTRGSFCNYTVPRIIGRCACSYDHRVGNTAGGDNGNACSNVGYRLGSPCGTTAQCSRYIPGSVCTIQTHTKHTPRSPPPPQGIHTPTRISAIPGVHPTPLEHSPTPVCACPPGHIEEESGTRCIPVLKDVGVTPASLGQLCESTSQCEASDPFSHCLMGVCHCLHDTHSCSARNPGCHTQTFQCHGSGQCISWYFLCDGKTDCEDGSDESSCVPNMCPRLSHTCRDGTCVSRAKVCDGNPDCPDGSDEDKCKGECPSSTFQCKNGNCLPGFVFCNALSSCDDGSDEDVEACVQGSITSKYCPFRCRNGRCRSTAILCSGKDGCGDNSDEEKCSVCSCAPKPS